MQMMVPSSALAKIVGANSLPRTEATKKVWEYIKKHNLQNDKNKRMIDTDENLRQIFEGNKQVSMFEMTKFISDNLKQH